MEAYCTECGCEKIEKVVDTKNTRLFICPECFTERAEYIKGKPCEHEYDDRNGNRCVHCGDESINYGSKK
ncbi:hypothetical protein LCGC14_1195010 [marine sediment metagenome]|uniref:Uncharacterized protein n=1 Tax=marine sediment metagenome TaxID=412755 RepID=A0A0F9LIN5_9ZZZZ